MTSVGKKIALAVSVLAMACGCLFGAWRHKTAERARVLFAVKSSLETDIEATVPRGSDRTHVEELLRSKKLPFTLYENLDSESKEHYGGASAVIDTTTGYIDVPLSPCQLHLTFKFDSQAKLLGYDDKFVCKGPFG